MAYTELCCKSGGSNLNSGSLWGDSTEPGGTADFTYAGGGWVQSTRVFTVASGNPSADGVQVGMLAAVDTGATNATFFGRISAVSSTTITIDAAAIMGTSPANGTYTLRIGGAWEGPNGSNGFPLTSGLAGYRNLAGNIPRINLKNAANYDVTANMTFTNANARFVLEGYTNTYGDGGFAIIDGGTSGAAYTVLTVGNGNVKLKNLIVQNNGATGGSGTYGILAAGAGGGASLYKCIVRNVRGHGFGAATAAASFAQCSAHGCNQSNTLSHAGFNITAAGSSFLLCASYKHTTGNTNGFRFQSSSSSFHLSKCLVAECGADGVLFATTRNTVDNCAFYKNGGSGLNIVGGQGVVSNSIFALNSGAGIIGSNQATPEILNCGFGAGTFANAGGDIVTTSSAGHPEIVGTINYPANQSPWIDPDNGDFRLLLADAASAGYERWLLDSYSAGANTIGNPDIGMAQVGAGYPGARLHGPSSLVSPAGSAEMVGDFEPGAVILLKWNSHRTDGVPITLGGTPAFEVYKDDDPTPSTAGVTHTVDFASGTGNHLVVIDTSADGTFYSAGSDFSVEIATGTISGINVARTIVGSFSISNRPVAVDLSAISTLVDQIWRATYDTAPRLGDVITLSDGSTQVIHPTLGRTTTPP